MTLQEIRIVDVDNKTCVIRVLTVSLDDFLLCFRPLPPAAFWQSYLLAISPATQRKTRIMLISCAHSDCSDSI